MPNPLPADHGYIKPAEWIHQEALWLSWPHHSHTWPDNKSAVEHAVAHFAAVVSQHQQVCINYSRSDLERISTLIQVADGNLEHIRFLPIQTNDAWCRDHGPLFVKNRNSGKVAIVDWHYNAWGGKFPPWDLDDQVPWRVASTLGIERFNVPITGEGGGIEVNGEGLVLTTEPVFLTDTRNPGKTKAEIEGLIHGSLGTDQVIWMSGGLIGDNTDGHVDTLTRFFNPDGVVTASDPGGPNEAQLQANRTQLEAYRKPDGGRLEIIDLPLPEPVRSTNGNEPILPASYCNFVIVNHAVLVPTYSQPKADDQALHIVGECFPGREVVPIDCSDILLEGGALHCLCTNQPA